MTDGAGDPQHDDPRIAAEAAWADAVAAARVAERAGDRALAVARLREVTVAARGSGGRAERAAWSNLAWLCVNDGREAEALLAARRAQALMRAAGDPWGEAVVLDLLGHLYGWAEDRASVVATADALDALRDRVGRERARSLRSIVARHRAVACHLEGDAEAALRWVDAAADDLDSSAFPGLVGGLWLLRVDVLLDARRADDVAALLRAGPPPSTAGQVERLVVEARLALATGAPEADAAVARALEHVESRARGAPPPARQLRAAVEGATALRGLPGGEALVTRAYDAAAGAALERLVELDAFRRGLEPAAGVAPEDLRLLDDLRQRLLRDHAALAEAVARRLDAPGGDGPLVTHLDARDGLVCVCAWCQRVRGADRRWLPVQQFLPLVPWGRLSVTHGLCEECAAGLRARGRPVGARPRDA